MRITRAGTLIVLAAVIVALDHPTAVGAAQRLSVRETPSSSSAPTPDSMAGVSCAKGYHCMAVGQANTNSGTRPIAEWLDGKSWKVVLPKVPAKSTMAAFNGVACKTSARCIAVGTTGTTSLTERWNGSKWHRLPSPSSQPLNAISCPTTTACVAVGGAALYAYGTTFAVAEMWNGKSWRSLPVPRPAGAEGSSLFGVACHGIKSCMAVGYSYTQQIQLSTYTARWNGSVWAIQKSPNVPGNFDYLQGVSCTASTNCVSVGTAANPNAKVPGLVVRWNGSRWTLVRMPKPASTKDSVDFTGVSCVNSDDCQIAGSFDSPKGGYVPSTGELSGTKWHVERDFYDESDYAYLLKGVSCSNATSCVTVGDDVPLSLVEGNLTLYLAGKWWRELTTPNV